MKRDKCAFLQPSVEYLGHKVNAEGLHALPSKVEAIVQAPAPNNLQLGLLKYSITQYLGLLNYYGKFIPNLATLIHPLNSLLQHAKPWAWTKECSQAFQQAKEALHLPACWFTMTLHSPFLLQEMPLLMALEL